MLFHQRVRLDEVANGNYLIIGQSTPEDSGVSQLCLFVCLFVCLQKVNYLLHWFVFSKGVKFLILNYSPSSILGNLPFHLHLLLLLLLLLFIKSIVAREQIRWGGDIH